MDYNGVISMLSITYYYCKANPANNAISELLWLERKGNWVSPFHIIAIAFNGKKTRRKK